MLGLAAGCTAVWLTHYSPARMGAFLLLCGMPAFIAGLVEDITKNVSPRRRLVATAISAALAIWLVDAIIVRTDLPGIDWAVSFGIGAVLFTVFVVTGIANALNIIDGFNGLSSMCAIMMLAAIAYVAYQTNDAQIATLALLGAAAIFGFFIWNFPNGLIFLGDGGAYFTGFYLAELSILLVARNPKVSPLFPLLMCVYPIFETLFSIYRRKVVRGRPVGLPDGVHLHSLIYRRVMRWAVGDRAAKQLTRRNSMTSPYLWVLCMSAIIPSILFWDSSVILALSSSYSARPMFRFIRASSDSGFRAGWSFAKGRSRNRRLKPCRTAVERLRRADCTSFCRQPRDSIRHALTDFSRLRTAIARPKRIMRSND